jgi:hypothetical protein
MKYGDVGKNTGTRVDFADDVPFRLTGTLGKLMIALK